MLGIENAFLVGTAILNAALGLFLFLQGKKDSLSTPLIIITASLTGWTLGVFFFRINTSHLVNLISIKATFVFALIIAITVFYFSYIFPAKESSSLKPSLKKLAGILTATGLVSAGLLLGTELVVEKVAYSAGQKKYVTDSIGYIIYAWCFIFFYGAGLINLWRKYFVHKKEQKRKHILLVTVGLTIAGVVGAYLNLILPSPFFQNQQWIALGPLFSTAIVFSIFYAIYRYQLFAAKVIATEILTFLIWFSVLLRALLSSATTENLISNYGLLVAMTIFGIYLVRSVHREVKAREEAEKLTKELKELNQQKSRMLSIASHQFRSPLTSIEGYASMIKEGSYGDVPEYLDEPISRIVKSSQKLAHIVDDFLNISRIEDGRMEYSLKRVDLKDEIAKVIKELGGSIDEQRQELYFETDNSDSYPANIDIGKFQQAITNLVDNAIKYTEEGEIVVRLKRENSSILIEVEDEGIGIDPKDTDKIFSQFARSDEAKDVNVAGSGLGLYIAQQIINAHDGNIWATSPGEGRGSTFHVRIPTAETAES